MSMKKAYVDLEEGNLYMRDGTFIDDIGPPANYVLDPDDPLVEVPDDLDSILQAFGPYEFKWAVCEVSKWYDREFVVGEGELDVQEVEEDDPLGRWRW